MFSKKARTSAGSRAAVGSLVPSFGGVAVNNQSIQDQFGYLIDGGEVQSL